MSDIAIRRATDADLTEILELLRVSMGRGHDPRFDVLFRWKHLQNPFGPSPMWVAECNGRIVGFRVFMRWEFERRDAIERAVRAVDTATHPEFQGRGIFSSLTRTALEELANEGVDFVFNTPNAQSRPGYLKMGWHELGRPFVSIRPTSVAGLATLRGARTPAEHWSEPFDGGVDVDTFLCDEAGARLLEARGASDARRTRLDATVLAWRYGLAELAYRVIADERGDGAAFVRIRRRGSAREAVIALVVSSGDRAASRRVLRHTKRIVGPRADYLLALGVVPGWLRSRRLGPMVTARSIAGSSPATLDDLELSLGDIELF